MTQNNEVARLSFSGRLYGRVLTNRLGARWVNESNRMLCVLPLEATRF